MGLAWGAVWLSRGRMEWRIGSGRITLRRRFGSEVKDVFEAVRLELNTKTDSDSDDWYVLDALCEGASDRPPTSSQEMRRQWKSRRRVASSLRDSTMPRQLGAWLSKEAGVPLRDATTPEAREALTAGGGTELVRRARLYGYSRAQLAHALQVAEPEGSR